MDIIDTRKLPASAQKEKCRTAVNPWKKSESIAKITRTLDISSRAVQNWINAYKEGSFKALTAMGCGRPKGISRSLTPEQEVKLQKQIADKQSDQLKLDYVLWTRKAVRELIESEYVIKMSIRTVGDYLKCWGFTPQKPAKRTYEQNSKAVKKWLEEDYPEVEQRAKLEDAEIYWGDEAVIRRDCQHELGYAPKEKTPIVRLNAKRASLNFLKQLITTSGRKVYLTLGNLRVIMHESLKHG
ncbi:IS630 family transposase [uncultured Microbulbifer sp.]|uniref:IS630 family transposase n=1 Tax=uncultured Microbulbifer sp. TaxID=348147 RepID=UPI00261473FF|nr:IS630 family transposase [uncultured Microbulbifer sp.]